MTPRPNQRERILDAARQRLLASGPAGLVLDAVAADAGVSKGGLLYHFPNKEALVGALVEHMVTGFDLAQGQLAENDSEAAGSRARAYLRSTVTPKGEPSDGSAQLMAGILAGLGGDRTRLATIHEAFERWQAGLEDDGIDPVRATLVRLAADGLWLAALLGLPQLDKRLARKVLAALDELTRS